MVHSTGSVASGGASRIVSAFARVLSVALAVLTALAFAAVPAHAAAAPQGQGYQIYPTPHEVSYGTASQALRDSAEVYAGPAIDAATKARLEEVLGIKGIDPVYAQQGQGSSQDADPLAQAGKAVVAVGVRGSGDVADKLAGQLQQQGALAYDDAAFEKAAKGDAFDPYVLASVPAAGANRPDILLVLGSDTDAAFYGLTTLYQIFQQVSGTVPGASLPAFTVTDWADVQTRGFIEGFYDNPWSVSDRANLMRWAGYYKENAYIYAPKDDPKHNARWSELYTDQELKDQIAPLAQAGEQSKVRYVYALHPFMYNPITKDNYADGLEKLKAKYQQVIDAGVRQIALLADDAYYQLGDGENAGAHDGRLYVKLLDDLTTWLHGLQAERTADGSPRYPGLKDTLVFCPADYYGNGEAWYKTLPANVRVINTGGMVPGSISHAFSQTFKAQTGGVAPFMWTNWPCTDSVKNGLIMGAQDTWLTKGLQPGDISGSVLNPMPQAEPSKVAIFMQADYTWNLWQEGKDTNKVWQDSMSYVDGNSYQQTDASRALFELAQNMTYHHRKDNADESVAIQPELKSFSAKLQTGKETKADWDKLKKVFDDLSNAAATYTKSHGNKELYEQMKPWIETAADLGAAGSAYCDAGAAAVSGDDSGLVASYSTAQAKLSASRTHTFQRAGTRAAEVGIKWLTPFVDGLDTALQKDVSKVITPGSGQELRSQVTIDKMVAATGMPADQLSYVTDGDDSTAAQFMGGQYSWIPGNQNPIPNGASITVTVDPARPLTGIAFKHDAAATGDLPPEDGAFVIEWLPAGADASKQESWRQVYSYKLGAVDCSLTFDEPVRAQAIRARRVKDVRKWWHIATFEPVYGSAAGYAGAITNVPGLVLSARHDASASAISFKDQPGSVTLASGQYIGFDLGTVGRDVRVALPAGAAGSASGLRAQTSVNGLEWTDVKADGTEGSDGSSDPVNARYVRFLNGGSAEAKLSTAGLVASWLHIAAPSAMASTIANPNHPEYMIDGDLGTTGSYDAYGKTGDTITFDLGQERDIRSVAYYIDEASSNYLRSAVVEASDSADPTAASATWTPVLSINRAGYTESFNSTLAKDAAWLTHDPKNVGSMYTVNPKDSVTASNANDPNGRGKLNVRARYLRIRLTAPCDFRWVGVSELVVNGGEYVSSYGDARFTQTGSEQAGKSPANLMDGSVSTAWAPEDASGSLTYSVDTPIAGNGLPYDGIRIVSQGAPSGAKVTAEVYDDGAYRTFHTVELGTLSSAVSDFRFGGTVRRVIVSWDGGKRPAISEVVLLAREAYVRFLGLSVRKTADGQGVDGLRFGYLFYVPKGSTVDFKKSGWTYGLAADRLTGSLAVTRYLKIEPDANGAATVPGVRGQVEVPAGMDCYLANIVFKDIDPKWYGTSAFVRSLLAYTPAGEGAQSVKVEGDQVDSGSVSAWAKRVQATPGATEADAALAAKILAAAGSK